MPDTTYIAIALATAVAITVTLRAAPFAMKTAMQESALLADVGRWMPLGAITILAVYCLAQMDEMAGVAVTVLTHVWRRNLLLSIAAGTGACLILTNLVLPA